LIQASPRLGQLRLRDAEANGSQRTLRDLLTLDAVVLDSVLAHPTARAYKLGLVIDHQVRLLTVRPAIIVGVTDPRPLSSSGRLFLRWR
jgi:hypothetical protein